MTWTWKSQTQFLLLRFNHFSSLFSRVLSMIERPTDEVESLSLRQMHLSWATFTLTAPALNGLSNLHSSPINFQYPNWFGQQWSSRVCPFRLFLPPEIIAMSSTFVAFVGSPTRRRSLPLSLVCSASSSSVERKISFTKCVSTFACWMKNVEPERVYKRNRLTSWRFFLIVCFVSTTRCLWVFSIFVMCRLSISAWAVFVASMLARSVLKHNFTSFVCTRDWTEERTFASYHRQFLMSASYSWWRRLIINLLACCCRQILHTSHFFITSYPIYEKLQKCGQVRENRFVWRELTSQQIALLSFVRKQILDSVVVEHLPRNSHHHVEFNQKIFTWTSTISAFLRLASLSKHPHQSTAQADLPLHVQLQWIDLRESPELKRSRTDDSALRREDSHDNQHSQFDRYDDSQPAARSMVGQVWQEKSDKLHFRRLHRVDGDDHVDLIQLRQHRREQSVELSVCILSHDDFWRCDNINHHHTVLSDRSDDSRKSIVSICRRRDDCFSGRDNCTLHEQPLAGGDRCDDRFRYLICMHADWNANCDSLCRRDRAECQERRQLVWSAQWVVCAHKRERDRQNIEKTARWQKSTDSVDANNYIHVDTAKFTWCEFAFVPVRTSEVFVDALWSHDVRIVGNAHGSGRCCVQPCGT